MTTALASVEAIRAAFPALDRRQDGRPVAYFDGPGGTQVPRAVGDAMLQYLYGHNANTHWNYPTSHETDAMLLEARRTMADFLGGAAEEIVFGPNMTTLTMHLARGLGRAWESGDEIVVTDLDHHGNIAPWTALARERGVTIRRVPFDTRTGQLSLAQVRDALGPKTRLLAIGAASNALGTITDVAEASGLAHAAGALAFVDAVHYAPHALPDVAAIGCDFLACSPYKFYGPHLGVLWGRRHLLETADVPRLDPAPAEAPERLETGTQSHEAILGAAAAVDFLAGLADGGATRREGLVATYRTLHRRGQALLETLWAGLSAIDGVWLYGPPPDAPRTPTLGFTVRGVPSSAVAGRLAEEGVFVSHGDFYAATVIERLGLGGEGLVRAGAACYTTEEEVRRLVAGVAAVAP